MATVKGTSPITPPKSAPARHAADRWLQLDSQLCFALYSTSLAMTKLYKPLLEPMGITYPQYLVLVLLWERDAMSVGELGERLSLDSGTLTPLLKRMQGAGWLLRDRSPDDERRVMVTLTIAGRALKEQARRIPKHLADATGCSVDQVSALVQQLRELRTQLQEAHAHPAAAH